MTDVRAALDPFMRKLTIAHQFNATMTVPPDAARELAEGFKLLLDNMERRERRAWRIGFVQGMWIATASMIVATWLSYG